MFTLLILPVACCYGQYLWNERSHPLPGFTKCFLGSAAVIIRYITGDRMVFFEKEDILGTRFLVPGCWNLDINH